MIIDQNIGSVPATAWPHTEIRGARCKVPDLHTLREVKARSPRGSAPFWRRRWRPAGPTET